MEEVLHHPVCPILKEVWNYGYSKTQKLIQWCKIPRKYGIADVLSNARFGGFLKLGVPFLGGLHTKAYSILGSILGSPNLGKLPFPPSTVGRLGAPANSKILRHSPSIRVLSIRKKVP